MKPQTIIAIVYGMYLFIGLMFVFIFYWMNLNKYSISISRLKDGALINSGYRVRVGRKDKKDNFYPMYDLFGLKPISGINYSKVKDYITVMESLPIIGAKYNIELNEIDNKYIPWVPPVVEDIEGIIENIDVVELNQMSEKIWESTDTTSKADMLYKVVVPSLLIILAIATIIFFPKIYNTIVEPTKAAVEGALGNWQDMLNQAKPIG